MRKLKAKDLGLFSKIVGKLNLKDEVNELFVTVDGTDKTEEQIEQEQRQANEELGVKLVVLLVEKYWMAEKEVYRLLTDLTGMTVKEVQDLPFDEFVDLFMKIKEDESFNSFFKLVTQ